ncbi:MAG: DNA primase [Candidatus Omnitrophota bacterium]|nr:DNA primase [Candidatus Omnitrophota bacterium]
MSGRIPENILEDILNRVNIVEIISEHIPLKRAGRNFRALCPFHHEKTPSFMVSPERQIYHCFGCHESGNVFKFLMSYERLEFLEAVEFLARKTGVALPKSQEANSYTDNSTTQLYKINELAGFFYANLLDSQEALEAKDYLLKRGLKQESLKFFKIGYSRNNWDSLINYFKAKNIGLSVLEKAGLIIPKNNGGYYDRFRNRIIIPIFDIKSRVIGFGARVLPSLNTAEKDDALPKYINSPETFIYTKGRNLFGLNFSKDSIREKDFVVVVEGYLDFILPFQGGIKNIVASQGTALTLEQIRLIKRYTHNVVMVYDPDSAGEAATLRSLDTFLEEDMDVKVACLVQGFDPDLYVRKYGIDSFKERIENAQNLFDYKLGILKSRYNFKEIEGKAKISSLMLETINKFKNAVLKSEYIKKLSQSMDIKEEALLEETKKVKGVFASKDYLAGAIPKKIPDVNPTEKLLIKLMLEEATLIHRVRKSLAPGDFQDKRTSRIVSIMFDLIEQGKSVEPHFLMNSFAEDDISRIVCESMFLPDNFSAEHKEQVVDDCIQRLKTKKASLKRQELHEQIKAAQASCDKERLNTLMGEFHSLIKKK